MPNWLSGMKTTATRLNDNAAQIIGFAAITATTSAAGSTTELIGITTPTALFRNNRAFRLTFKGRMVTTVANDQGEFSVRKTDATTSPKLLDTFRISSGPSAGTYGFYYQIVMVNTSGADISVPLVGTYARVVGSTGTIALAASTNDPAFVMVEDIGDQADFPGAAPMT